MNARFEGLSLARPADEVDLSTATTAKRTGPAVFVNGALEIPFDRELTATERRAVWMLLSSRDNDTATYRQQLTDYLALTTTPNTTQNTTAIRAMAHLVLALADRSQ